MTQQIFSLPYGHHQVNVHLPNFFQMQTLTARVEPVQASPLKMVQQAIQQPIQRPALHDWVQTSDKVAIITSDATRPALQSLYLPAILEDLQVAGIPKENITLVIAPGTHRAPTAEEIKRLIGGADKSYPVIWPNCDREEDFVQVGLTSRETPVKIFRPVVNADRVILTGSIHHHVLAGYSAGPKSLFPGVAARDAIQHNHALALNPSPQRGLNPMCQAGLMDGNPFFEDLAEALALFPKPTFLVNVIPASEGGLSQVVAGAPLPAHRLGTELCAQHYGVSINTPRAFVLASCGGHPMDMVFYQSTKGLINLSRALQPGGTGILFAACEQGLGAPHFFDWLNMDSPKEMEKRLRSNFTVPGCVALIVKTLIQQSHLILVSGLPDEQVRKIGIIPASSAEQAVQFAKDQLDKGNNSGYCLPQASITVPKLSSLM